MLQQSDFRYGCPPGASGTPDDEPRPLTDVYRLCTTRFGRKKYRTTWPAR